jgi:tRNA U38,U39,U40 pseudouridine synthase TruA
MEARAFPVELPNSDDSEGNKVICVELVGNRFLRQMVRILVATALRESSSPILVEGETNSEHEVNAKDGRDITQRDDILVNISLAQDR